MAYACINSDTLLPDLPVCKLYVLLRGLRDNGAGYDSVASRLAAEGVAMGAIGTDVPMFSFERLVEAVELDLQARWVDWLGRHYRDGFNPVTGADYTDDDNGYFPDWNMDVWWFGELDILEVSLAGDSLAGLDLGQKSQGWSQFYIDQFSAIADGQDGAGGFTLVATRLHALHQLRCAYVLCECFCAVANKRGRHGNGRMGG